MSSHVGKMLFIDFDTCSSQAPEREMTHLFVVNSYDPLGNTIAFFKKENWGSERPCHFQSQTDSGSNKIMFNLLFQMWNGILIAMCFHNAWVWILILSIAVLEGEANGKCLSPIMNRLLPVIEEFEARGWISCSVLSVRMPFCLASWDDFAKAPPR